MFQDRANNNNANTNDDDILDEELGDFQLPLSLTPRASSSTGHAISTTNVIQHRPSTSSLQHNVVLHSNLNESSTSLTNRFDSNLSNETEQSKRQTNSLMTVHEQGSANDLLVDDSWHIRSPTSASDVIHKQTTDEKQMV